MSETTETVETKESTATKDATKESVDQLSFDPEVERLKQELTKANKEREQLKKQTEEIRLKRIKESEDKDLYIRELEAKMAQTEQEKAMYSTAYMEERKLEAIKSEARKAGLHAEYEELLEKYGTDGVEIETTSTGRMNVLGAATFVSRLKSKYPRLFESKGSRVNAETPTTTGAAKSITLDDLAELKKKAEKSGHSKSKEWQDYAKAIQAYKAQEASA